MSAPILPLASVGEPSTTPPVVAPGRVHAEVRGHETTNGRLPVPNLINAKEQAS